MNQNSIHNDNINNNQTKSSKENINSPSDDDWLVFDPLGLDMDEIAFSEQEETESTLETMQRTSIKNMDMGEMNNKIHTNNSDAEPTTEAAIEFDGDTSRANPHFRPLLPKPIHKGESGRQLIMDTETTGLDALKGDRIIEVGIIELVDRKFTGEKLHVYINPQRGMDEEVIRVHGITEAFLEDKPTFDKVAQQLYDFMLGAEVIAHNAPFDIGFLSMEFDKVGLTDFAESITITDSLVMAKQQYPGQKNTLDALVRRLNVGKMDRTFHGALLDAEILAEVYLAMTGGQVSLAIDEDTQTQSGGSHANFSHLANKLVTAQPKINDHFSWVAKMVSKHPDLMNTQGITCFHAISNSENPKNDTYLKIIKPDYYSKVCNESNNRSGINNLNELSIYDLKHNLFLAS